MPIIVRGMEAAKATARKGVASGSWSALQKSVQPAVRGGLHAGRRRLHVVLRVEVRARAVRRAGRMNDRQLASVEQRLQRSEARVQTEESVKVDGAGAAVAALSKARGWQWWDAGRDSSFRRREPRCSAHRPHRAERWQPESSCARAAPRQRPPAAGSSEQLPAPNRLRPVDFKK